MGFLTWMSRATKIYDGVVSFRVFAYPVHGSW